MISCINERLILKIDLIEIVSNVYRIRELFGMMVCLE